MRCVGGGGDLKVFWHRVLTFKYPLEQETKYLPFDKTLRYRVNNMLINLIE